MDSPKQVSSASSDNSPRHYKASSSSFVSTRNPSPSTGEPYREVLEKFQNLWSETNPVQEQRFQYMGSSSSTNPYMDSSSYSTIPYMGSSSFMGPSSSSTNPFMGSSSSSSTNPFMGSSSSSSTNHYLPQDGFQRSYIGRPITQAQLMASLASINGVGGSINGGGAGTLLNSYNVGNNNYLSSMNCNSLDHRVPLNSMSRVPASSMNYQQLGNGFTLENKISPLGYSDDRDLDLRNIRFKLIESKGWPVDKVLKILYNDPSLLDEIEPSDIVMLAELKLGSKYLEKILNDQDPLYFNKIFYATIEDMFRLMSNSEGACVVRNIHSLCDLNHMKLIVQKVISRRDDLRYAARNEAGADTLLKLIRVLKSTSALLHKYVLDALVSEICVDIMRSKPGSNLFKACLKYLDASQNKILHKTAATYCIDLATDDSGYFSILALIENTPNPYKEELLLTIAGQAAFLSKDPKGNYVIQAIFKLKIPEVDVMICRNLGGKYLSLSTDKCASNVVEKCIMSSGMEYPIVELILSRKLHLLSQDSMGNYVVQTALNATQFERVDLYDSIVGEIQPYLKELQYHPIGRNVFRDINKRKVIMGKFVQCPPIPM